MQKRKLFWTLILGIFIVGVIFLSLFSSKTLATSKGGRVTQNEYMKEVKQSSAGQQLFTQMVLNKALNHFYKDQVTDSDVDTDYTLARAEYGNQYQTMLSSKGQSDESFKEFLRQQLLTTALIKDKVNISDDKLKDTYKSFTPTVNISMISVPDQATAKEVITKLNDGDKFASVAKKYSTDSFTAKQGGQVPAFDSSSSVPSKEIRNAAFKLDTGSYSAEPIQTDTGYVILYMRSKDKKAKSWTTYRSQLTTQYAVKYATDSGNQKRVNKLIGHLLERADVSVKDKDLKSSVDQYILASRK